jgi:Cdc6-like AAA superfamily ATPase
MEKIDINKLLNRENDVQKVKDFLSYFENNKNDPNTKRGLYIYGAPGIGKTTFILDILKELDYDVIKYDSGDVRNKTIMETISQHNISDKNIISLFYKKIKRIIIVMDEIDGMNCGDKGGINSLIKIIRPKKTKKQKEEETTLNPIICIGNIHIDKKIKELKKVCCVVELLPPTNKQMKIIISQLLPEKIEDSFKNNLIDFLQGDLRKFKNIYKLLESFTDNKKDSDVIFDNFDKIKTNDKPDIYNIFQKKTFNDDTKIITKKLFNENYNIEEHSTIINETDRTIIGLLWHENIIDVIGKMNKEISIPFYLNVLDNICISDYIDRITFQKQIWQFNEMSSLIKTFKNNKYYHKSLKEYNKKIKYNPLEIRFTKVLTKYSTEYNNYTFIQKICHQLNMDKKDMISYFIELKNNYNDNEIYLMFYNYDINKLDINRMYRYIDKYVKNVDIVDNISEFSDC